MYISVVLWQSLLLWTLHSMCSFLFTCVHLEFWRIPSINCYETILCQTFSSIKHLLFGDFAWGMLPLVMMKYVFKIESIKNPYINTIMHLEYNVEYIVSYIVVWVAQLVQHMSIMWEALGLIPSLTQHMFFFFVKVWWLVWSVGRTIVSHIKSICSNLSGIFHMELGN